MLKRASAYDWSGVLAVLGLILVVTGMATYMGGFEWWRIAAVEIPGCLLIALAVSAKWQRNK